MLWMGVLEARRDIECWVVCYSCLMVVDEAAQVKMLDRAHVYLDLMRA
jgi:hypothetical protein